MFDADGAGTCPGTEPREFCGTPTTTTTSGAQTVTVTAQDADANRAAGDRDTLTFQVTVFDSPTVAANPATLTEANLNGARLTVTLPSGFTFASGVSASSFTLATNPTIAGLTISNVTGGASGTRTATLTLATGAGYSFSRPSTLAVRVLAAAHSGSTDMTSGTLAISPTPGITLSRRSLTVQEDPTFGGGTNRNRGTYTVVLDSPPTGCASVVVRGISDNPDVTFTQNDAPAFTNSNWNVPVTVTVTAALDNDNTHDTATISYSVFTPCNAAGYTTSLSLPSVTVTVTVNDDEAPRVAIASTSPASLTEANLHAATVTVALTNATFASDATASSFALLTDIRNVSVSQVSGGVMGTTSATLTLSFTGDSSFAAVETLAVQVPAAAHTGTSAIATGTVNVTPTPGIALSRTTLALEEDPTAGGGTNRNVGTYTIALTADPTRADGGYCGVTIEATSNNADATIDTDSSPLTKRLLFDGSNWSTPQTVTVTAGQDVDGVDDVATIGHTRTGACSGGFFGTPTLPSVTVNDDETPAAAIASPTILTAATLNNATLTVSLERTTYASGVTAAGFELVTEGIAGATASVSHTRLPFAEQIAFFRSKLDLPTRAWTDIWQDEHDRAFVVAGAAHADLVADLRGAVDKAIADGTTLATFRKDFDSIVAKHGWSYNGGRDWRTRVIYSTNLRTSYAAGRYQQMKDVAEHRPFWRYRHSHASKDPRHDHLAWDGLILRHDDPWFDTHYPPGGWGCKCYIETLAERDLKRLGKDGPDAAPAVRTRTVTVGAKGPSPRTVTVPVGIDPGWAYAPGKSVLKRPPTPTDPFTVPELSRADATAHRVGAQAGSNPGGLYRGTDGKLRYVKYYDDAAQSYGEAVANNAYRALGLDAPASALVRDGAVIVGIANEYIDHAGALGSAKRLAKGRARKVLDGYAADVWLANWDAVGLNLDNVVATRAARNAVARIDQGGALLMRARRGRKPAGVLDQITEWEGFGNPQRNPAYVRVLRAAAVESGDALGRAALKQIAAIEALGKRTRDFRDLAPTVRGVADADQAAILAALRTRARLLKRQIDPRVRKAMAEARALPAYARETRSRMGHVYTGYLSRGQRKVEEGFEPHRMTDPELAVSFAYTTSDVPWGYKRPNQALRDAERDGTMVPAQYDDYRKTLSDALRKLPDYPARNLKRGVTLSPAEIARYVPGRIVTEAGFTSASYGRGFSGNVRFIIHGRHGKRIDRLSAYPKEGEVLFDAGTRFRVLRNARKPEVVEITMEEVDDG